MANAISFVAKDGTLSVPYTRIEKILNNLTANMSLGLITGAIPKYVNEAGEFVFRRALLPTMQKFDPTAGPKAIGMDNWTFEPKLNFEFDIAYQSRDLVKIQNAQTLVNDTLSGMAKIEAARMDCLHIEQAKICALAHLNFFNAANLADISKTTEELKPIRKYISVIRNDLESTTDEYNVTLDSARIWLWTNGLVNDQYIESLTPSAVKTQLEINGQSFTQVNGLTIAKSLFLGRKFTAWADKANRAPGEAQWTFDKTFDFSNLVCLIKHSEAIGQVYRRYEMQDLPYKGGKRFTYSADVDAIGLYTNLVWAGLKTKPTLAEVNAARTTLGLSATSQGEIDTQWAIVPNARKNEIDNPDAKIEKDIRKEMEKILKENPNLNESEAFDFAKMNLENSKKKTKK